MKSAIRRLGGLILGLMLLCGSAIPSNANHRYWHGHYRVYYGPVYHYYPRGHVYYYRGPYVYYPRGYYETWHRHHPYGWHHHYGWYHRDWD